MVDEPEPGWIEKTVKLAAALGMNPTRVRWKLLRWQETRRRTARRREQKVDHIRYAHKTCHECGAVQDRDAKICSKCGAKLASRAVHVLSRLGIFAPEALSMSTLLALALMACYVRVMVAQGGGFGSPSGSLLVDFGAKWLVGRPDDHWRMLTAAFLHIGLWHIAFNLIGLATIGPQIEAIYGRLTMLFAFIVTAVAANIGSGMLAPHYVSAGASGGLCGLIGLAAGYAQRRGRVSLRNDMLKWLAYTIIMGFAIGADNWAHTFGALLGGALGYAVPPETWKRPVLFPVRALAKLVGVVATIAAIAIIMTRQVRPPDVPFDRTRQFYELNAYICRIDRASNHELALAEASHVRRWTGMGDPEVELTPSGLGGACAEFVDLLDRCRTGQQPESHYFEVDCPLLEQTFGTLPR